MWIVCLKYCCYICRVGYTEMPEFAAPEVVQGAAYGCAVDVWATGVLLYLLLSGNLPFYSTRDQLLYSSSYSVWTQTLHHHILQLYTATTITIATTTTTTFRFCLAGLIVLYVCCQIESRQWSFITDDARQLVTQMLEADPSQRVTVEDALKHPWIRVSYIWYWCFLINLIKIALIYFKENRWRWCCWNIRMYFSIL